MVLKGNHSHLLPQLYVSPFIQPQLSLEEVAVSQDLMSQLLFDISTKES